MSVNFAAAGQPQSSFTADRAVVVPDDVSKVLLVYFAVDGPDGKPRAYVRARFPQEVVSQALERDKQFIQDLMALWPLPPGAIKTPTLTELSTVSDAQVHMLEGTFWYLAYRGSSAIINVYGLPPVQHELEVSPLLRINLTAAALCQFLQDVAKHMKVKL